LDAAAATVPYCAGFAPWRRRFQGDTTEGTIDQERVILLRPSTFMNDSGRAVQEAANFFKIAAGDITVFQDELELPADRDLVAHEHQSAAVHRAAWC